MRTASSTLLLSSIPYCIVIKSFLYRGAAAKYFEKTGHFQSEIVLDKDGYLIDGYTSYLLAAQHKMKRVPIRYGKRQVIKAYHRQGGKLYEWELPQNMIDRVSAGNKVLVHTKHGVRVVTVVAVEPYKPQEHTQNLRTVIKAKRGGVFPLSGGKCNSGSRGRYFPAAPFHI